MMRIPGYRRIAAALVFLLFFPLVSLGDAGPRLDISSTSVDYGKVPVEQFVKHRFSFKNVGTAPLEITNKFCHDNLIRTKALEGC